jgi:hypothetical protein
VYKAIHQNTQMKSLYLFCHLPEISYCLRVLRISHNEEVWLSPYILLYLFIKLASCTEITFFHTMGWTSAP